MVLTGDRNTLKYYSTTSISGDIKTMGGCRSKSKITPGFSGYFGGSGRWGCPEICGLRLYCLLIIAWLLSYLIGPAVNYMTQRKVPTTLAVVIILIISAGYPLSVRHLFIYARISAFATAYPMVS